MAGDARVVIRRARRNEASIIHGLVRRAYEVYVPRMDNEPGPMLDDYPARIAERSVYVLEGGGSIAGVLVLLPAEGSLLLDNVAVDPALQGRGYGRALIDFAEAEARRRGCTDIRLYTHATMVENLRLYARLGYAETHRITERGYDRVYMAKRL